MNTPAHLLFGAALFGDPKRRGTAAAAIAGALLPDASLYLMTAWSLWVQGVDAETIFRDYYFSPSWQAVFAVDNSIPLWSAALLLGVFGRYRLLTVFAAAGLLHLGFDLALHHDDGRPHFWPLTDWVFASPVSYWDNAQGAATIGPIIFALVVVFGVLLWRSYPAPLARLGIVIGVGAEAAAAGFWRLFF